MRIDLACKGCGGNRFSLAWAEEDSSVISCEDCGHVIGTLAALKAEVARRVIELSGARPPADDDHG